MTINHAEALAAKLECIISGHKINTDDADWLRAALSTRPQQAGAVPANQSPAEGDELPPLPEPAHSREAPDYTADQMREYARAALGFKPQPKGTEPVGHFIEDFGGEKGRWQQCKEAAHYTVPLFREPAQAPAPAPEVLAFGDGVVAGRTMLASHAYLCNPNDNGTELARAYDAGVKFATQAPAVGDRPEAAGLAEARDEGWRAALESAARICDATPPSPFRPSIEAARAIRQLLGPKPRCTLCGYQHGHAIGCERNPVDLALQAASQPPVQHKEGT